MEPGIQKRYDAFWARSYHERAVLHLTIQDGKTDLPPPENPTQQWADIEYRLRLNEDLLAHTTYAADAYPASWVNLGPGVMAAMIGSDIEFAPDTVWFGQQPLLTEWSDLDKVALLPENPTNQLVLSMTRAFLEHARGGYLVGMTDLGGTMDILASLRGTEQLLMDLIDAPDEVDRGVRYIDRLWLAAFQQSYDLVHRGNPDGAMSAWIPLWCRGSWYPLQCDFAAMISPEDFGRFVMPSLVLACEKLDHSVYHLDGVGELPHVRQLLSIDRLDAIQWVPGAGKPNRGDLCWYSLYEEVQRAGKGLVMTLEEDTTEEILYMLRHLSHNGLFLSARVPSLEEADLITRKALEYAHA